MPRPEPSFVTFEIDGREVRAPEGSMLVDGAKHGDVEIPYFCYEPKLGAPVGACRMCLVEIDGIPKLQTACSTPVKDGMVVITTSDRVKQAQNAIVEFLLVNHPLDCPVCDKGGECPLQDITFGWGPGRSRFIEPKRHFRKPLELSPLVAIDRERCILCYRCVRFSQEISEDYQLVFVERADDTYVGTHAGHPYVAPFSGNIVELCPVGALTSTAYRFRARPWDDVEQGGSVCTLCPSQCNVSFSVRDDEKVVRVLARDNHDVDDGWLCDKGRFGYQAIHAADRITRPLIREEGSGSLAPASWDDALAVAAAALRTAGSEAAALVGGGATNEEGFLIQRLMRGALGSPHVDSRAGGELSAEHARALSQPALGASVPDIDYAGAVLVLDTELVDEAPMLDLRVRKAARRNNVKVVVATSRPGTLDPNADAIVRFAPGAGEAALGALAAALAHAGGGDPRRGDAPPLAAVEMVGPEDPYRRQPPPDPGDIADAATAPGAHGEDESSGRSDQRSGEAPSRLDALAERAGAAPEALQAAAELLNGAGPVVVLWGERLSHGERGPQATSALLDLNRALGLEQTEGAGLIEVPAGANSRGLREVGCLPNLAPGLREADKPGLAAGELAGKLGEEVSTLLLFQTDPPRTHPDGAAWAGALERASFVVAFADFASDALAAHADVILPAESYAEKEGTVTHPDGRIQRVRQAVGHPGEVRAGWRALTELEGLILGLDPEFPSVPTVTERLAGQVPFYDGLTLEELGGHGVRWQEREAAAAVPRTPISDEPLPEPPELPQGLRLGTARSLWASREAEHAPVLHFLIQEQRAELSTEDARRLGIAPGDEVEVRSNGSSVRATATLRDGMPAGSVFLIEGTRAQNVNALTGPDGATPIVEVSKR